MHELKIPRERVAVLIGEKGKTKKEIEKKTKTKLDISKEGDVIITGEAMDSYITALVVKSIGRGFNPKIALILLDEKNVLDIISIPDIVGKSSKKLRRVKARLIGTKGKARKLIENLTGVNVVIYGKTVALIGDIEDVFIAKKGIENLLRGTSHGNVYRFLQNEVKKRGLI